MDLQEAKQTTVDYINLYGATNLEEEKMEMLRTFFKQINDLTAEAAASMAPPPGAAPGAVPQAQPMAPPQSDLMPFAQ